MTLADGKLSLAGRQQEIVAAQAKSHAVRRADWRSCGEVCRVKDDRDHAVVTLSASSRCGFPAFAVPGAAATKPARLAIALPLDAGVGSASGASLRADDVPGGC